MPVRALRQIVLANSPPRHFIVVEKQRMPVRALRQVVDENPLKVLHDVGKQRMPVRALRRISHSSWPRRVRSGKTKNARQGIETISPPVCSGETLPTGGKTKNARQGIETAAGSRSGDVPHPSTEELLWRT